MTEKKLKINIQKLKTKVTKWLHKSQNEHNEKTPLYKFASSLQAYIKQRM